MRHNSYRTDAELGGAVANEIAQRLAAKPNLIVGWPSGRSTLPLLDAIEERSLDFSNATIFMMDDYVIGDPGSGFHSPASDDHFSCRHWVNSNLLPAVSAHGAPEVKIPSPSTPEQYDRDIEAAGGIDVFLAGIGASDAHIAFNPPGTEPESLTHIARLADTTRSDNLKTFPQFKGLSEVPKYGVTVGIGTILGAREVITLAVGPGKASIVARILDAGRFVPELPASAIYMHSNSTLSTANLGVES